MGLCLIVVQDPLDLLHGANIHLLYDLFNREIDFSFVVDSHVDWGLLGEGERLAEWGAHGDGVIEGFEFDLDPDGVDEVVFWVIMVHVLPLELELSEDGLDLLAVDYLDVQCLLAGVERVAVMDDDVLVVEFVVLEHGDDREFIEDIRAVLEEDGASSDIPAGPDKKSSIQL